MSEGHEDQERHELSPLWHSSDAENTLARLGADAYKGLSNDDARQRLKEVGPNCIQEERQVTFWKVAREEVTEPMILLLLVVAVLYGLWGEVRDAIAIFLIITGISFVEIFNEYRAKAAIASLQRLASSVAPVVRGGIQQEVDAKDLVPGDLVLLNPGERVPADLRILAGRALRIDESTLTGESVPATKTAETMPEDTELADRRDMAYAGTLVTSGKGRGVVVATGMGTEIGRIAGLIRAAREPRTPLQVAMRQLAGYLVWLALGFSILVPVLGYLAGQPPREMVLTGLTLAFATIPEELPILITIVLGLGSLRLSRRNAIVKRIRAAETLGSVSVIASDKTGTITENHMTLSEVWLPGQLEGVSASEASRSPSCRRVLELGVLACDATVTHSNGEMSFAGDPIDVALLEAAVKSGLDPAVLRGHRPLAEFSFDDQRRRMSAAYPMDASVLVAAKGAPEGVIAGCTAQLSEGVESLLGAESRAALLAAAEDMAKRGLRVLGVAYKFLPSHEANETAATTELPSMEECEADMVISGLVGLADPARVEVPAALN
ncbi:MAG: HAD-IC family P-type ATPase, partial [Actinobacteria bacterium]|nr:HAD-IC family P-type ATPase [Actinomycetota bacterium]